MSQGRRSVCRFGIAAAILANALAAIVAPPAEAAVLDASNYQVTLTSYRARADYLSTAYNVIVQSGWGNVLGSGAPARGALSNCDDASTPASLGGFCYNSADESTQGPIVIDGVQYNWHQSGVSSSADSQGSATASPNAYWGRQMMVAGWHVATAAGDPNDNRASYLSFIDWDAAGSDVYNRVLLVLPGPASGTRTLSDERLHINGISWYGHLIYVTGTWDGSSAPSGVTVFDMNDLLDISGNSLLLASAHGVKYVLPAVGVYKSTGPSDLPTGSMSLDRSSATPALVFGGYATNTTIVRFNLYDAASSSGPWLISNAGVATGSAAWQVPFASTQGILAHNGVYYLDRQGAATDGHGWIQAWDPTSGAHSTLQSWADGAESLSFWQGVTGSGAVWGNTEYYGRRYGFEIAPSSLPQLP